MSRHTDESAQYQNNRRQASFGTLSARTSGKIGYSQTIAFDPLETKLVLRDLTSQNQPRSYSRITDDPLGIIRLDWRMAVMVNLTRCPHGVGTSKPVDGEDDLAEWAAIDKAYPRSSHSRFPSTPGISRAMPTDDLLDQFFAEPSGKRARAQ
jgi:hypothetical protein